MTRLPTENQNVKGLPYDTDRPKYKVGPLCAVPGCSRLADHAHHIWRRSFLSGDYGWVRLWDGRIVGNLVGLCWRHHADVTENRARIFWNGSSFEWIDESNETASASGFLLDPQPKVWSVIANPEVEEPAVAVTGYGHPVGPGHVEKCPTCQRALRPKESTKKEGARPRKAWTVSVPVDQRENGADVLDVLLGECAKLFGHDEEAEKVRYHTLVQALYLVVQNGEKMISDA